VWSEDYKASDANVHWDLFGNLTIRTNKPPTMPPGVYWFMFYVEMNIDNELPWAWGMSATNNGHPAMIVNPSGLEGFGTAWAPAGEIAKLTETDLAFTLYSCQDDDNDDNDNDDNDTQGGDDDASHNSSSNAAKHSGCGL
jgi:hypothetical protein